MLAFDFRIMGHLSTVKHRRFSSGAVSLSDTDTLQTRLIPHFASVTLIIQFYFGSFSFTSNTSLRMELFDSERYCGVNAFFLLCPRYRYFMPTIFA